MAEAPRLPKPAHGAACNRCGLCCHAQVCPLGVHVFGLTTDDGPCPALSFDGAGQSSCGLVADPATFDPVRAAIAGPTALRQAAALLIGAIGRCDSQEAGEPADELFKLAMWAWRDANADRVLAALATWGMKKKRSRT
jgi:hypothetical protein